MKFDFVFFLPLLAMALVVFFPMFNKDPQSSKSIRSRKYRKILLSRLTVVVLLAATIAATMIPLPELTNLAKALLFGAAVLIPAYLAHFYMSLRYKGSRKNSSGDIFLASENVAETGAKNNNDNAETPIHPRKTKHINKARSSQRMPEDSNKQSDKDLPTINLIRKSYSTKAVFKMKRAVPSLLVKERALIKSAALSADGTESPAEVQEQLDRVTDIVDSHDLGNSDYALSDDDLNRSRFPLPSDDQLSIESALTTVDVSSAGLSKMSSNEISELVTTLRTDKNRLQKLVFAQQSSLESERKAHDQSRIVARDAITIMRDARNGQKLAEKLARRERSERKRVERQYKKVAIALNNAMTMIEARKIPKAKVSS